ncbi:MAG: AAA domain-containing protein [Alphaproteobacteria bacterium]
MNTQPNKDNHYPYSLDVLKAGSIDSKTTLELFEKYGKHFPAAPKRPSTSGTGPSTSRSAPGSDPDIKQVEAAFLHVLVLPLKYKLAVEHGKGKRFGPSFIYPLCLPALLSREGKLSGNHNVSPFISRIHLSPQATNSFYPEIASLSKQDDFFTDNEYAAEVGDAKEVGDVSLVDWDYCWNYGARLWRHLTDADLNSCKIDGYGLDNHGVMLHCKLDDTPSKHLIKLYDTLIRKDPPTPLLKSFLSEPDKEKQKVCRQKSESVLVNENLIAQMNLGRPLSPSQKIVTDYFLDDTEDLFLTVNGPPGTGKTTLIQSLVANVWVKAALDKADPPIIVVASTNNNAVTNVLESFKTDDISTNHLFKRWLPDIHSFGTYCCAASKVKKDQDSGIKPGWLVQIPGGGIVSYADPQNSIDVENLEYLTKARAKFKSNFSEEFAKEFGGNLDRLSDISTFLHKRLVQAVNELKLGCEYQELLLVPFDKKLVQEKVIQLEKETEFWREKHQKFQLFEAGLPFYIRWGRYFPIIRGLFGKIEERSFRLFAFNEFPDCAVSSFYSENIESFLEDQIKSLQQELQEVSHTLTMREQDEQLWNAWSLKHGLTCEADNLLNSLNNHPMRSQIFYLANHYWEVEWLQDMKRWARCNNKSAIAPEQNWLRRAKISPCFVSTLYMVPSFFQHENVHLYNFIDYLIVDEAGQVSTYIATPNLALAKRAIIVGDTKQLEPIDNIPEAVDKGNCKKFNVISEEQQYGKFVQTGLAAGNSLMNRAHHLCNFRQEDYLEEPGFFLKEHWRCVPEIASYCNELAYHGALEPQRPQLEDRLYPALGYAHIPGTPEKKGASRHNVLEAHTIGKWVKKNEERLRQHYGNKPLNEIIAVISPFKAQASLLKLVFHELKLPHDITIGTVHSLQGAERPFIIFSPTYGESDSRQFIDNKVNLLNVASSRAKDSFLVFGNMAQFNPAAATPSGLLARKLFAHEDNEVVDIDIAATIQRMLKPENVEFIDSLDRHRNLLRESIQGAKNKILIISPYISINAVIDDNLQEVISEAIKRKAAVSIITDQYLDTNRHNTLRGREKLAAAGASVNIHDRIHDKVICVDDNVIVIGSFNWLSASRSKGYAKEERSTLCKGGQQVFQEINKHWKRINV